MTKYGYFDDSEEFKVTVSTTFDRKQFGELELVGTLMQYKEIQKDYWDRIGVGGSVTTSPILWKDMLFFGACDKNFYCLTMDGEEKWRFQTKGVILEDCAVDDGIVFFESYDHNIYALDCFTGRIVWKFPTNGPALGHITIHNGIVYGNSFDRNIYAIEGKTGKELWRLPTAGSQAGAELSDGILYFGYFGCIFYAYDIKARRVLWTFRTQKDTCGWAPVFWKNNVYIGSFEGNAYALNKRTGDLVWKFSAADTANALIVSGNRVYFGSNDYNVYCLDAETGRLVWKFVTAGMVVNLAKSQEKIYFGSYDNNAYCLDGQTGREIWKFKTNGFVHRIRTIGNRAYFSSWDCHMYCVDNQTGNLIWKFKTSLGTPSPIEPPETGMVRSAEVVWKAGKEESKEKKAPEAAFGEYGKVETEYAGAGMGDYLGKKKRGYV